MARTYDIGLKEALSLTFDAIGTLPPVPMPVHEAGGLVAATDMKAVVDCPSATSSLRDGYAVVSADIEGASRENGISLKYPVPWRPGILLKNRSGPVKRLTF
jgi:molybdopterin molybdotransferase